MPEERRSAKRSRLAGLRATYEGADGADGHADVFNISRAGLFLETANLVPVGKRLSLEVHVTGEPAPWLALGRVIWARASHDGDDSPCGMGVKLIDVEDEVVEAIDRLVDLREPTEPGIGLHASASVEFDQTMIGMGTTVAPVDSLAPRASVPAPASTPVRASVPAEPEPVDRHSMPTEPAPPMDTIPAPESDAIEPLVTPLVPMALMAEERASTAASPLAIPLVRRSEEPEPIEPVRRRPSPLPAKRAVEASPDEPNPFAPPATKRGGRTWIAVLVALVAIAAAGYVAHGLLQGG